MSNGTPEHFTPAVGEGSKDKVSQYPRFMSYEYAANPQIEDSHICVYKAQNLRTPRMKITNLR